MEKADGIKCGMREKEKKRKMKREEKKAREIEKETIKALDVYLKEPDESKAKALSERNYHRLLEKKLEKTGTKFIEEAVALLEQDERTPAEELLRKIANDKSLYSSARLKALTALEKRGAQIDGALKEKLSLIEEIAKNDDAQRAEKLYPTLDEGLTETFAATVVRAEAVNALEGAARSAVGKPTMKPLRRAGHILSSKGKKIALPEAEPEKPVIKSLPEEKPISFVTHFDSAGKQLILFVSPTGRIFHLFQAIIDEEKGIEDFMVMEITRKEKSSLIKEWQQNPKFIQADDYYSLYLLRKAEELTKRTVGSLPKTYASNKFLLPALPSDYEPPDVRKTAEESLARVETEKIIELHKRPDFFWWGPDDIKLKVLEQKLEEISSSPLVLTESQRKQQIETVIENGAKEYLTKHKADTLANRWEEAARVFAFKNDWEAVKTSLRAAEELRRYADSLEQGGENVLVPLFVIEEIKSFVKPAQEEGAGGVSSRTSEGGIIIP